MPSCFHRDIFYRDKNWNCHSMAVDGAVLLDGLPDLVCLRAIQTAPSATTILGHLFGSPRHSRDCIHRRATKGYRVAFHVVSRSCIGRSSVFRGRSRRRRGQEVFPLKSRRLTSARLVVPDQTVDATPSGIKLF